jgi:hypothetical protein
MKGKDKVSLGVLAGLGALVFGSAYSAVNRLESGKCTSRVLRNALLFLTVLGAVMVAGSLTVMFACGNCTGMSRGHVVWFGVLNLLLLITSSIIFNEYRNDPTCDTKGENTAGWLIVGSVLGVIVCLGMFIWDSKDEIANRLKGYRKVDDGRVEMEAVPVVQPVVPQPAPAPRPPVATQPAPAPRPPVATQPAPAPRPPVATQPAPAPRPPVATQPAPAPRPPVATQPVSAIEAQRERLAELSRPAPRPVTEQDCTAPLHTLEATTPLVDRERIVKGVEDCLKQFRNSRQGPGAKTARRMVDGIREQRNAVQQVILSNVECEDRYINGQLTVDEVNKCIERSKMEDCDKLMPPISDDGLVDLGQLNAQTDCIERNNARKARIPVSFSHRARKPRRR